MRTRSRLGITAAAVALICAACDAPGAGPSLPPGAHWVGYTEVATGPIGCGVPPAISAGTSLNYVRARVIAGCRLVTSCVEPPNSCWQALTDEPGNLYVAVLTDYECTRKVSENVAVYPRKVYFVHWIGSSSGACNEALAQPAYRLFLVPSSDLPTSGPLTVELQIQTEGQPTRGIDTVVPLS